MEYCGGGSISDLIQANGNEPLDEEVIAYICKETLAGLAYLHSIGKVLQTRVAVVRSLERSSAWKEGRAKELRDTYTLRVLLLLDGMLTHHSSFPAAGEMLVFFHM